MITVVVYDDTHGFDISTDILPGDVTVQIPPKVYEQYLEARRQMFRAEEMIRMFVREQDRQRAYADD